MVLVKSFYFLLRYWRYISSILINNSMKNYYVYQYVREDGTPYYIGKGRNRRAWEPHKRANGSDMRPKDKTRIQILKENLSEQDAWDLEDELILKYGRQDLGTGILANLSNGGRGGQTVSPMARMGKNNPRWGVKEDPAITEQRIQSMLKTKNAPNYELYKSLIIKLNEGKSATSLAKESGVGKGVVCKLKNRTHGIFTAFPELIELYTS
jgi:hypothetical protein